MFSVVMHYLEIQYLSHKHTLDINLDNLIQILVDGRAILLGEINNLDIQLKGIGQTPFSRRGDGKSALSPVLREYIISEFMNAAGIPTTRALLAASWRYSCKSC